MIKNEKDNYNIAFIVPFSVVPITNGARQIVYDMICGIARKKSVSIVMGQCEEPKKNSYISENYFKPFIKLLINIPKEPSLKEGEKIWNFIKKSWNWSISEKPMKALCLFNKDVQDTITNTLLSENIHIIICEYPYAMEYLKIDKLKKHGVRIIIIEHDVDYILEKESFKCSFLKNYFIKNIEVSRMKKYEIAALKKADRVICIAPGDAIHLKKLVSKENIYYLPPIMHKRNRYWQYTSNSKYIIFSGSITFYPNYHGIKWLIEKVLPRYFSRFPYVTLKITGQAQEKEKSILKKLFPDKIEFTGLVDDKTLEDIITNAMIAVVPIFKGSGIKTKLLEALSYGVPSISTCHGQSGIPYEGDAPYLTADTSDEFLLHLINLTENVDYRKKIGERGRYFFESIYASEKNIDDWILAITS